MTKKEQGGITHQSLHASRLKYDSFGSRREAILAKRWDKEQHPPCFLNGGIGVLAHLVTSKHVEHGIFSGGPEIVPDPSKLTQRDADVAATVIQWLGTNCGFCFLEECLKEMGYEVRLKTEPK